MNASTRLLIAVLTIFISSGCAVTYTPAPVAATNVWTQVSKSEWVHYDGHYSTTATIRANTLLFYRTAPCPRGSRNSQHTLGWVAGDRLSYAATDCSDRRLVVDVTRFDQPWFTESLPRYVQLAYLETKVARRSR